MKVLSIHVLVAVLALFAGQRARAADFTYEDLVQLIQQKHLTSVEGVLPLLPEEMRSSYALMHESRSLQDASFASPRAILFGKDAKLTCAFNGDPAQRGYDMLECFQFRDTERAFDFRQIQFPSAQNGLTTVRFSQRNQTADGQVSCTVCHGGPDPRPNWDSYNEWPGAYGSNDDTLDDDAPQYAGFVAHRSAHPRYRWLLQGDSQTDPYDNLVDIGHRPNLRFSDLCGRMNSLRTGRILESKVPRWQALAYAVSALDCSLTDAQKAKITQAGRDFATDSDPLKIMLRLGVTQSQWTTDIFTDPEHGQWTFPWEHQSGYSLLSQDTAMAVIQDRAREGTPPLQQAIQWLLNYYSKNYALSPDLPYFQTLNAIVPDIDYFGTYGTAQTQNEICPALTDEFMAEYLVPRN